MSTKWTKGPWKVIPETLGNIESESGVQVAQAQQTRPIHKADDHAERLANATLMAAAPEMYEALEQADGLLTQCLAVLANEAIANHLPYGLKDQVRDFVVGCVGTHAIRKARGEQ